LSINGSPALKNALDEFLKRACEIARGDTEKSINTYEVWNDMFPIHALERDHTLPIILRALKASNFIRDGENKDEFKVTLNGIFYVIDNLNISPENLGVLSRTDVKKLEVLFLQSIYEQTKGDPKRTVSINDIQNRIHSIHGTAPFVQMAEYLSSKGLIEIVGGDRGIGFRVPSKQVKKYYPPPSPPSGSFTDTSFSSTSFST
jgi:hypothetical protein